MTTGNEWLDQARRLVVGLSQSLAATAPDTGEPAPGAATDAPAAHGAECRWCPLCQAVAVLRGERPEVTAALADVLSSAAAALRTLAEHGTPAGPPTGQWSGEEPAEEPGEKPVEESGEQAGQEPGEQPGDGGAAARAVQHIELA